MKKNILRWTLPLLLLVNACKKDDVKTPPPVTTPAKGLYVLSEGTTNNSRLGYYNLETNAFTGDFYRQQNNEDIGSYANDAIIYGSKLYIVVNGSGLVIVANAATAKKITAIDFKSSGATILPRYAAAARGKVYVTSYDGTVSVIDTVSLTITKRITVGPNPDGLAVHGNYLYVANSGGYNPIPDSTVSVVDLATETEIKKIKVGVNPQKVEVNSAGDVYVSAYGNFSTIPASVSVINSSTNTLKATLGAGFQYSHLRIFENTAYLYNNYGGADICKVYNTATNTIIRPEFITDNTVIITPYGVNIDDQNGDVYFADAKDFTSAGQVTGFNKDGQKKITFSTSPGINPNKVLFIR